MPVITFSKEMHGTIYVFVILHFRVGIGGLVIVMVASVYLPLIANNKCDRACINRACGLKYTM